MNLKKYEPSIVMLAAAAWLVWVVRLMVHSPGVVVHDEIGHFLTSRDAWYTPSLILDIWEDP